MEQSPWKARSFSASQETPSFTEPEGSLTCLLQPATRSYPEPVELSLAMCHTSIALNC